MVLADGYRGFVRRSTVEPDGGDERAFVRVEPEAAGHFMASTLTSAADGAEPIAQARAAGSGPAVVAAARQLLGAPYEWGGMTCRGIDCSGLVQTVHRRFGRLLPRDADDQQAALPEVDGPVRPGDLYCFGDHIAIAVGDGSIVHAAGSRGQVVEEPLPPDLFARVLAVTRVFA